MASKRHLEILDGDEWNVWRKKNPKVRPNLRRAQLEIWNLEGKDLSHADLRGANLQEAVLWGADLRDADLSHADLRGAHLGGAYLNRAKLCEAKLAGARFDVAFLSGADFSGADLSGANLRGSFLLHSNLKKTIVREADLVGTNFFHADLTGADLTGANLNGASLVEAKVTGANFDSCSVYGISAWNLKGKPKIQKDLIITPVKQPPITVDDLKIAQFLFLLMQNREIRQVIDTITSKVVLILGRFTSERKAILDKLRVELRKHDFVPIIFDFSKPLNKNLTETVAMIAQMARFVIADITDAKSIPQELQRIVPDNPSVPVQPLILSSQYEYAMFEDFLDYDWVLDPYRYDNFEHLLASLTENVTKPPMEKARAIRKRRDARKKRMQ